MGRNLILLLVIIATATACKKHLNRKDAATQIINAEHYPIIKDYEFTKGFIKDVNTEGNGVTAMIDEEEFKEEQKMIEDFEKNKLVKFEEIPHREETTQFLLGTTVRTWTEVNISLTEEGKRYLIKEDDKNFKVKLWETSLDTITGIKETGKGKMTTVEYTVSNKGITPFGENFNEKGTRVNKTTYFSLYDDGWRVSNGYGQ